MQNLCRLSLNAGTLALSFSAVLTFAGHLPVGKQSFPINDLLNAWKLLIFSIVAALISNWLYMNFRVNTHTIITDLTTKARQLFLAISLQKLIPETDLASHLPTEADSAVVAKKMRLYGKIERTALTLGLFSQLSTFWAYLYLYRFAKVSLSRF